MRLPRPNRLIRVSVRSLFRQLGVGATTAHSLLHGEGEAILICERVVFCGAIVELEHLLGGVSVKMKRLNRNVGSFQGPLQETPEEPDRVHIPQGDSLPREQNPFLQGCGIRPTCRCRRWTPFRRPAESRL